MAWSWILRAESCTGCGICADVCVPGAIQHPVTDPLPAPGPEPCVGCQACVEECPFDALEVKAV